MTARFFASSSCGELRLRALELVALDDRGDLLLQARDERLHRRDERRPLARRQEQRPRRLGVVEVVDVDDVVRGGPRAGEARSRSGRCRPRSSPRARRPRRRGSSAPAPRGRARALAARRWARARRGRGSRAAPPAGSPGRSGRPTCSGATRVGLPAAVQLVGAALAAARRAARCPCSCRFVRVGGRAASLPLRGCARRRAPCDRAGPRLVRFGHAAVRLR